MSPAAHTLSSRTLVADLIDGHPDAFARLDATYRPMIISIARRCRLSHDDAEDIAQETLMIAYRRIMSLSDPAALTGWIRTTALRQSWRASDVQRRQREHQTTVRHQVAADIDEQLIAQETHQRVVAAIESLSARERLILELTVTTDAPVAYALVASRIGCAVGSVGALRGRALAHLARIMEPVEDLRHTPRDLSRRSFEVPANSQSLRVA